MGNACPSNCAYDCCDQYYNCTNTYSNCTNFYYNYTWVYWTVSVLVFILFFFFFICLCRRRRAAFINQPMLVDNTIMANRNPILDNTSPMYSPNPNYYNGQRNVDNRFNQPYNNQPGYNQPGYNQNNVNLVQGQQNQQYNHQGYEMGEPVFLSNDNNQPIRTQL